MHQRPILLHELPLLNQPGKLRRRLFGAGVDHHTSHIQVEPMDGEYLAPQLFQNRRRHGVLRVHAHGLYNDRQIAVGI